MAETTTTIEQTRKGIADLFTNPQMPIAEKKTIANEQVDAAIDQIDLADDVVRKTIAEKEVVQSDINDLDTSTHRLLVREVIENSSLKPAQKSILEFVRNATSSISLLRLISPVILKATSDINYIAFSGVDTNNPTQFEFDLYMIGSYNPRARQIIHNALIRTAESDLFENFSDKKMHDFLSGINDRIDRYERKKAEAGADQDKDAPNYFDLTAAQNNYIVRLFEERGLTEELELTKILLYGKAEHFWGYYEKIYDARCFTSETHGEVTAAELAKEEIELVIKHKYIDNGKPPPGPQEKAQMIKEKTHELVSNEFKTRVTKLVGQLYHPMDIKYRTLRSELALQKGAGIMNISVQVAAATLIRRLEVIQTFQIPEKLARRDFEFYKERQERITIDVPVESQNPVRYANLHLQSEGNTLRTTESREVILPYTSPARAESFFDYINYVQKNVEEEVAMRLFLHDARALPHDERVEPGNFWQMLHGLAAHHLNVEDIDTLYHHLPNSGDFMYAGAIWEKLYELKFAGQNWIHGPNIDVTDPGSDETDTDRHTREYVRQFLKDSGMKDWEIDRVIAMGIGLNYATTLRKYTIGAAADSPRTWSGVPTNTSYSQRDSALYNVFNFWQHSLARWSSESANSAGLLSAKIAGEDLHEIYKDWHWRSLMDNIRDEQNAWTEGMNAEDARRGRVALQDIINVAQVGSIFDRLGWRAYFAYLGWFKDKDVMGSFKAMEHIGVDIMNNFLSGTDITQIDKSFYKAGSEAKRKEFISYLYRRYFVNPDRLEEAGNTDQIQQEIQQEIDAVFQYLETPRPDLGNKYKNSAPVIKLNSVYGEFYNQVISRAMAQRIPTKFLRIHTERRRKTSSLRATNMTEVFNMTQSDLSLDIRTKKEWSDLSKDDSRYNYERNAYIQALEDICAYGEALMRRDVSSQIKQQLAYNDNNLAAASVDTYVLTPKHMEKLWEKYGIRFSDDDSIDKARKKNALMVLKATRKYIYDEMPKNGDDVMYLDKFAATTIGGDFAHKNLFAQATEELDPSLLGFVAGGENTHARLLGEIAEAEEKVTTPWTKYYSTLRKYALDGVDKREDFSALVQAIADIRKMLSGTHGSDPANFAVHMLVIQTVAFFKKNTAKERWVTQFPEWLKQAEDFSSLAGFITNSKPGECVEWEVGDIRNFLEALIKRHLLPIHPYKANKAPKMALVAKLNEDGTDFARKEDGSLIYTHQVQQPDFEYYAGQMIDLFLDNPLLEIAYALPMPIVILILATTIGSAVNSFKFATGEKK